MPPAKSDAPEPEPRGVPPAYPISQAELAEYKRLDGEIRRQLDILTYRRGQILAGMGGSDVVEPGWYTPVVTYRPTGTYTLDDDGEQVEVIERRLTIVENR